MENNQGYKTEREMMSWFKGKPGPFDCVDFYTSKCYYEVKSCKLIVKCTNGNDKREYTKKPHKKIMSSQSGRFYIKIENHKLLKIFSERDNKIPRYIFVITNRNQKLWRVLSWKDVDSKLNKTKEIFPLRIKDIFKD